MQTQNVEQIGCVYKRIKGRRRRSFDFERIPAIKEPGSNGSVLLRPLPAHPPVSPRTFVTVTLAEGVTVQLAKQNGMPQEPKLPRDDGSAQCSELCVDCRHIKKCICVD